MRPLGRRLGLTIPVFLFFAAFSLAPHLAHADIDAMTADDVCAPTEDPCEITEVVKVPSIPAELDFGTRTVNVTGNGQLDFGSSRGRVLAGNININPSPGKTGVKVRKGSGGQFVGGDATIVARRSCSLDVSQPCVIDLDCAQLRLGTCDAGPAGTLWLNGKATANGDEFPGSIELRAAGEITIDKNVRANATRPDADSGAITISSLQASVTINDVVEAKGGGASTGGDIDVESDLDITLNAPINASSTAGEDAEGGTVVLFAGRDIFVNDDIDADGGSCAGGTICIDGARDVIVNGVAGDRTAILANGGTFIDEFNDGAGGDGGDIELLAGDRLVVGEFTKLQSDGGMPDGDGAFILTLSSTDGSVECGGQVFARASGNQGTGGAIGLDSLGSLTVLPTAIIDVSAGNGGGGDIEFLAGGDLDIQSGSLTDAGAGNQGSGGSVSASGQNVFINSRIKASGEPAGSSNGDIDISGCEVFIQSEADLVNDGGEGLTVLVGRDVLPATSITIDSGASIDTSGANGINEFFYADAAKPPVIDPGATIDPAQILTVNLGLTKCAGCGNGQDDLGETCDDGNLINGDGCSADCQLESCIGQSIDYPAQPLCNDGNGCTVDTCNIFTGNCEHVQDCSDQVGCTDDVCINQECVNTPNDANCDDSEFCTDEFCDSVRGCVRINLVLDCDDGLFCNGADTCSGGECQEHAGSPCADMSECGAGFCNEQGETCDFFPFGTPCSDDGDICTDDVCDGAGNCAHNPNTAPCDDGFNCTEGDVCGGGVCAGTPNAGLCNDGNLCTDDSCQIGVGCVAVNNTDPCDDGQACTIDDTCTGGMCVGDPQNCGGVCGDGSINDDEECDNGASNGLVGNACDAECNFNLCGQPTGGPTPVATDALFVIQAGVGSQVCDLCICDVTGNSEINASDGLGVLRRSVGLPIPFSCLPCL